MASMWRQGAWGLCPRVCRWSFPLLRKSFRPLNIGHRRPTVWGDATAWAVYLTGYAITLALSLAPNLVWKDSVAFVLWSHTWLFSIPLPAAPCIVQLRVLVYAWNRVYSAVLWNKRYKPAVWDKIHLTCWCWCRHFLDIPIQYQNCDVFF